MRKINLIKVLFLLLFELISNITFGQEVKMPNLALPSPQASEISTFGNVPVDESNGRISPSIPLPNYIVGKLQLPMQLNYAGNGVKVEQKPTWTGINWILNAGGVITRTVRDLPDETNKPRYFFSKSELEAMMTPYQGWSNTAPPYLLESGSRIPLTLQNEIATNYEYADSEVDEFNFSFSGYSGSFFLKKNTAGIFEAKQIKYENELKIEILGNFNLTGNFEFKITTPDGVSYFFGGYVDFPGSTEQGYAVEETQFVDRSNGYPEYGIRAKTAFYLTKIENHLGDKIFFEYYTKDVHEVFTASNVQITANVFIEVEDGGCGMSETPNFTPKIVKNIIYNAKFLKKIWNLQTSQKIIFNSFEAKERVRGGTTRMKFRVLSSIDYGYGNINFEYTPTKWVLGNNSSTEKFFLSNVIFKNIDNTIKNEEYKMEYNDPLELPANTFSNAQDFLGFYNGKNDNPSLLPKNSMSYSTDYFTELGVSNLPDISYANFSSYDSFLGDRSPSYEFASKGLLQKITYPTGGSTIFEYEPIVKDSYSYTSRFLSIYNNSPVRIPASKTMDYADINYDLFQGSNGESNLLDTNIVYINQTIDINLNIKIHDRNKVNMRDLIYIKMTDADNNQHVEEKVWYFPSLAPGDFQTDFTASIPFNLAKDHRYHFQIGFRSNVGGIFAYQNPFVEVTGSFQFISGLNENEGAGIRIKRVKDYENNNAVPINIKRFYYKTLKEVVQSLDTPDEILYKPFFHKFSRAMCQSINDEGDIVGAVGLNVSLHTNSFTQNLCMSKVLAMYTNVTISLGGDHFENGAIEKTFLNKNDWRQIVFKPTYAINYVRDIAFNSLAYDDSYKTNYSDFNGNLLREAFWTKNNVLSKQKEKTYAYAIDQTRDIVHNINGQNTYNSELELYPKNLFFGLYDTNSKKINKISETTKEFIDGVPITKYTTPPFALYHGWEHGDHDGDGIFNVNDSDFITPDMFDLLTDEDIEEPYTKIVTTQETNYYNDVAGLVSSVKMSKSDNTMSEVKNFYPLPNCISQVIGLNSNDISALNILKVQNRVNTPFQVETYTNSEKLSTKRIIYSIDEVLNSAFEHKIQTAKGNNPLEDRIVYHNYDLRGNPVELSLKDGTHVVYIWSYQRKPIYKIVNATYAQVRNAMSSGTFDPTEYDPNNPQPEIITNPFIISLPNAQVTIYNYDPVTQLLKSVIDEKGNVFLYGYDDFNRLKYVKDKDGNILNENEYHYKN